MFKTSVALIVTRKKHKNKGEIDKRHAYIRQVKLFDVLVVSHS